MKIYIGKNEIMRLKRRRFSSALSPKISAVLRLFIIGLLASPTLVQAQETSQANGANGLISIEMVQERLAQIQENTALEEGLKAKILETYAGALEQLRFEADRKQKAAQFEADRLQAPERLKEIAAKLAQPPAEAQPLPKEASAAELNQLLVQAESELAQAQKNKEDLLSEPARRAERRKQIPALIAEANRRLEEAQGQLAMAPDPTQSAELQEGRRILARVRIAANEAEKDGCEKELRSYEARSQLLTQRQDEAMRLVTECERRVAALGELVGAAREAEAIQAEEQAQEASARIEEASPLVREMARQLAEENAKLIEARTGSSGLTKRIEEDRIRLEEMRKELTQMKADFKKITETVENEHLQGTVGFRLREERQTLRKKKMDFYQSHDVPAGVDESQSRDVQERIERAEYELLDYQRQRQDLADIQGRIQRELSEKDAVLKEGDASDLENLFQELYTARRTSLDALIADCDAYIDLLIQMQVADQELRKAYDDFSDYIDKHILWIRSADRFDLSDIKMLWGALLWSLDGKQWLYVAVLCIEDLVRNPLLYSVAVLVFLVALILRWRAIKQCDAKTPLVEKPSCVAFNLTLRSFVTANAAALVLPAILAFLYYRLSRYAPPDAFTQGVLSGLGHATLVLISLELMRHVLREKGLGESHFAWPSPFVKAMRRSLALLTPWAILFVFLFSMFEWSYAPLFNDSLGRLLFMLFMLTVIFFVHHLFRPEKGVLSRLLMQRFGHRMALCYLCYALLLLMPLLLVLLSATGYYYTAVRLAWRIQGTFFFAFGVLVIYGMVSRWLLLARRRLAKRQAKQRREALKLQASEGEVGTEPELLDLAKVDVRTQRLVRWMAVLLFFLGLLMVWADVLPALEVFDEVHLWQSTKRVSEMVRNEEGVPVERIEERVVWITLRHLGAALLIVGVTLVLFRNLSDLLEVAFLQRSRLATGERYAITTIIGYCILLVGTLMTFSILGVGWSKVQWLVAAMGVGLGFGLQEIFANFFSGLIILFERPIRVGDTVTIGGLDGYVSRIRLRATRIIDWDRKELIIPNKEFISGQLINWTLSDQILRLIIPVGIAYGSNTQLANDLLYKVAEENPDVLKEPKVQVLFLAFGESSLDFELRVFCPNIDTLLRLRHELHMAIDQAFREAGIEIAFPQRDIHIRSSVMHGDTENTKR